MVYPPYLRRLESFNHLQISFQKLDLRWPKKNELSLVVLQKKLLTTFHMERYNNTILLSFAVSQLFCLNLESISSQQSSALKSLVLRYTCGKEIKSQPLQPSSLF